MRADADRVLERTPSPLTDRRRSSRRATSPDIFAARGGGGQRLSGGRAGDDVDAADAYAGDGALWAATTPREHPHYGPGSPSVSPVAAVNDPGHGGQGSFPTTPTRRAQPASARRPGPPASLASRDSPGRAGQFADASHGARSVGSPDSFALLARMGHGAGPNPDDLGSARGADDEQGRF